MLFDAQLQVGQLEVACIEDHIQMSILIALGMPVGPSQIMPIPAGILRFGLSKEAALKHGNELIEYAKDLPDPKPESDIIVAQSLSDVTKAAEQLAELGGK